MPGPAGTAVGRNVWQRSDPLSISKKLHQLIYGDWILSLLNPLIPQSWGTFIAGGHPQTPSRKYPAPLFQLSQYNSVFISLLINIALYPW